MQTLLTAVLYILTECGPAAAFQVETYELCLALIEITLEDAKCVDLSGEKI